MPPKRKPRTDGGPYRFGPLPTPTEEVARLCQEMAEANLGARRRHAAVEEALPAPPPEEAAGESPAPPDAPPAQ